MAELSEGHQAAVDRVVHAWEKDWGLVLPAIVAKTGLTLTEAMLFFIMDRVIQSANDSAKRTALVEESHNAYLEALAKQNANQEKLAKYLDREMPDEEWKG